jgi:hypothetical protein
MCAILKGTSHREVPNAASREANGIKMLQRTRDNSQRQFVACTYRVGLFLIETFEYDNSSSPLGRISEQSWYVRLRESGGSTYFGGHLHCAAESRAF